MRRRKLSPVGTLFMGLIVALALIAVGYGLWSQRLFITDTINTGNVSARFVRAFTDDDGNVDDSNLDANDTGGCVVNPRTDSSCDPAASGRDPKPRHDKDVGRCVATVGDGLTATITKEVAYPGYFCTAWFDVANNGTVPVRVASVEVEGQPVLPGVPTPFDLDNADGDNNNRTEADVAVHLTTIELCQQIDPGRTIQMDVDQQVLQDAPQSASLSYTVRINLQLWNEPCPQPGTDPFGLVRLTEIMSSAEPPTDPVQISEHLSVRLVGSGNLIDGPVEEPDPGDDVVEGVLEPDEPRPEAVSFGPQALRVFNTATKLEFELIVSEELLDTIHALRAAQDLTSATQGVDDPEAVERLQRNSGRLSSPALGWSNGVDTRVLLGDLIPDATTLWPWRTITHFSNNCSGTLIGPRHVITAAHCINQRGTNNWYSFTVTPGRDGSVKPFGDSSINPNPQPGDPFRWYFTPAQWRDPKFSPAQCPGNCFAATEWDWGLIIIPDRLGDSTGWMGYVARPGSQLNQVSHYNRGYPVCGTKPNIPANCQSARLYGDTNICTLGPYSFQGPDGWNRVIRNSCDISGGHSGSAVYHYFFDQKLGKWVPVVAMMEVWEHCYTCSASDDTPNSARRITPPNLATISFFRQWKP